MAIAAVLGKTDYLLPMMRCNHHKTAEMIDISETENKYYLSLNAKNKLGVIGNIGKICEGNGISLASIMQHGVRENNTADIIVITELCKEKDMQKAIFQFNDSEYISNVNSLIRVQI